MPRIPLLSALAAQLIGGAIVFGGAVLLTTLTGIRVPLMALVAAQGVVAAILGKRFGLAPWWAPIQLVLPPAVAVAYFWHIPAWVFLLAFIGFVLIFWNSARGGVPLYLSNNKTKAALATLLPEKSGLQFIDLGTGLGGPVMALAEVRPDGNFTGIESAPALFFVSWIRGALSGLRNIHMRYGNIKSTNLGEYDVVYCFLSPVPMADLYAKAKREMKPGSLLISNTFEVPETPAEETLEVDDRRQTRLLLWRF